MNAIEQVRGRAGGFTLLELIVAIAVLGIALGVVAFSWPSGLDGTGRAGGADSPSARVAHAASLATANGRPVTVHVTARSGHVLLVTALPDGRLVGGAAFGYDEITGAVARAR